MVANERRERTTPFANDYNTIHEQEQQQNWWG
jgi:hypothetical protein